MSNIRIINQMVDTLKLHFYFDKDLTEKQITTYNTFIDDMKILKDNAMNIKNTDNQQRFEKTILLDVNFNVMAQTVKSFSVLLQNGDLSIAFKHITSISSNPIIKVEFRSEYLTRYGYVKCINQVQKIISSILPKFKIKVSEIHLATDVQGYEFNEMDKKRLKFRNRTLQDFVDVDSSFFSAGTKTTGISIGKGDFMLRIYNKTHQITSNKHAGYVKFLRWEHNKEFNEDENVWRFEFQFRRGHLKTLIGKDGVLDGFENVLNSIPDLWSYSTSRITHNNLSDEQCIDVYRGYSILKDGTKKILSKDAHRRRVERAGISKLWNIISTFNNTEPKFNISRYKEIKKPEVQYVVNAFKGVVSTMVKLNMGDFNKDYLADIIIQANEDELNKKGFSILDNAKFKAVDYVNDMNKQYYSDGIYNDGFHEYEYSLRTNLKATFEAIENQEKKNKFFDECIKRGVMIYAN